MSLKAAMATKQSRTHAGKESALAAVTSEPMKRLNANIPASKHTALKVKAAKEGKDISALVNSWINEYLSKNQNKYKINIENLIG